MTKNDLRGFLQGHRLGVLATVSPEGEPQSAVMGIAVTPDLEIIFDTVKSSRKWRNLQSDRRVCLVIGWDQERTVQYEGLADEPAGEELDRLREIYFTVFPDGRERAGWEGITYFRVRPKWIRFSDFNPPGKIVEFTEKDLRR
ncbi:MAG TPA: pyridoxamine 5'-phosphate oxidase family protein [bacterium]|nr:pyridoxamine 5'-phosphate oxidase family protein [bacterium]